MIDNWSLAQVAVGDYIEVEIVNKKGDRNLDGCVLKGEVRDIVPSHNMVRLESGWCAHTKDRLLVHRKAEVEQAEKANVSGKRKRLEDMNLVGRPTGEQLDHIFECHDEIRRLQGEQEEKADA